MGKSPGKTVQTTSQQYDPTTMAAQQAAFGSANQAANSWANAGVDPQTQQALGLYGNMMGQGNLGLSALGGNAGAVGQLMNPYQSQVLDAIRSQYGDLHQQAAAASNDQATRAGAFGGSRAAVAYGTQQAAVDKAQMQQMAGLQYQGYNDAMGRAGQLANFGQQGAGAGSQLGQYAQMASNPAMRQMQIWQQFMGLNPAQMQSTQTGTQTPGHNGASGALGGAAMGAKIGSMFPGWGTGIGAAAGGLLGLFS